MPVTNGTFLFYKNCKTFFFSSLDSAILLWDTDTGEKVDNILKAACATGWTLVVLNFDLLAIYIIIITCEGGNN